VSEPPGIWHAHTAGPITREVEKMMLAVFVILVCALAALLYFVSVRRGLPPERPEQEREKYRELRW
jgi:NADH:ubiquinone oxidoreductase subunit 3 (subunit A)